VGQLSGRNAMLAFQAVIPLALFLILVLLVVLRERLPQTDEIMLGIGLALVGMTLFNIGIEIGLAKLGSQVGQRLPSSFKAVALPEQGLTINGFTESLLQTAVDNEGQMHRFFTLKKAAASIRCLLSQTSMIPRPRPIPIFRSKDLFSGGKTGLPASWSCCFLRWSWDTAPPWPNRPSTRWGWPWRKLRSGYSKKAC
jgi:hypothetical protein